MMKGSWNQSSEDPLRINLIWGGRVEQTQGILTYPKINCHNYLPLHSFHCQIPLLIPLYYLQCQNHIRKHHCENIMSKWVGCESFARMQGLLAIDWCITLPRETWHPPPPTTSHVMCLCKRQYMYPKHTTGNSVKSTNNAVINTLAILIAVIHRY